ncbi:hypothetical protein DFH06DRAFT_1123898 [Mycena polygramma]|nr:hypothetical protein DFH06DRAFT_1123898 [Mycena polygramma]
MNLVAALVAPQVHFRGHLALNYEVTPVSTRNLSRWLYLLARDLSGARPVRFPAVYRPNSVVGADIFIRCLDTIGPEIYPFDSLDQLPPGCYALFDSDGNPYAHPVGCTIPRHTFADTERAWNVPDHDPRTADRMKVLALPRVPQNYSFSGQRPVPDSLTTQARKRDVGLCCFTGNRDGDGIPLGPRWSTAAGQEAIRAFFWGRSEGPSHLGSGKNGRHQLPPTENSFRGLKRQPSFSFCFRVGGV